MTSEQAELHKLLPEPGDIAALQRQGLFLPFTLEMDCWQWAKKNPRPLFGIPQLFNPVLPHRHQRILERHLLLIDFLLRAVDDFHHWSPVAQERDRCRELAYQQWYSNNE